MAKTSDARTTARQLANKEQIDKEYYAPATVQTLKDQVREAEELEKAIRDKEAKMEADSEADLAVMAEHGKAMAKSDDRAEASTRHKTREKMHVRKGAKLDKEAKAEISAMTSEELEAEIGSIKDLMEANDEKVRIYEEYKATKLKQIKDMEGMLEQKRAEEKAAEEAKKAEEAEKLLEAKRAEEAKAMAEAELKKAAELSKKLQAAAVGPKPPTPRPAKIGGRSGPGKIYLCWDPEIQDYRRTSDVLTAEQMSPGTWQMLWVMYKDGAVDHVLSNDEIERYTPAF